MTLWIQWIMTISNSSMVTIDILYLATDIFPVLVIQSEFSLLPLGRYLLPVTTQNRYQSTGSSQKLLFTTTSRNVSIVKYWSWILSWFTEFAEFRESHLGKTQIVDSEVFMITQIHNYTVVCNTIVNTQSKHGLSNLFLMPFLVSFSVFKELKSHFPESAAIG